MKAGIQMTGRQVISKDTMNLPLGEFVCFKVEYDIKVLGLEERKTKGIDYITEDLGVVKNELYSKDGDIQEIRVVTKFTGY